MEASSVSAKIQNTPDDYRAQAKFLRADSGEGAYTYYWLLLSAIVLAAVLALPRILMNWLQIPFEPAFGVALIFGLILFSGVISASQRRRSAKLFEPGSPYLAVYDLDASESGVTMKSDLAQTTYSWRAFSKIAVTTTHAYLFRTSYSPIGFPKRCFSSETDFNAFVRFAESHIANRPPAQA